MASWESSWWPLTWMVVMHSAFLQVLCRGRRVASFPLLAHKHCSRSPKMWYEQCSSYPRESLIFSLTPGKWHSG